MKAHVGTFHARMLSGAALISMAMFNTAHAAETARYNIPSQSLDAALREFGYQSGHTILVNSALISAKKSNDLVAESDPETALRKLLAGTGLGYRRDGEIFAIIVKTDDAVRRISTPPAPVAAETVSGSAVEGLVVTAQKRRENIQDVPIAISAFTQDELTLTQIAGGPDLMTQIPNLTFTKTNFSGYSIQIRGIGTQAISATTDAAVAVALNNTSFIRNRFFEQEFFDLERIEVLRGPQGTLYGRNATAGVVNILTAKPSFEDESKGSIDLGNYGSRRLEAMVNIPLAEDKAALRFAGAWTTRDGYTTNQLTGQPIDGRDLWSTRLSLRVEPSDNLRANFIWEHFQEDDDRLRSGKQLCKRHTPTEIGGVPLVDDPSNGNAGSDLTTYSQGCLPASMYSDEAFQVPNGFMLPYYSPLTQIGLPAPDHFDPYVSTTQSRDLRVIESSQDPIYRAKSDLTQLQMELDLNSSLTIASDTAYSTDFLFSSQDFNRFNTASGAFAQTTVRPGVLVDGVFCDPQLGCSDRLVLGDLSTAKSRQFSQELRLYSDLDGPFNFSVGANFVRYDTEDKYYVFANSLGLWAAAALWPPGDGPYNLQSTPYVPGKSDNAECLLNRSPADPNAAQPVTGCIYMDPNPIDHLNDEGHNYFLSRNPYRLISYAAFGEAYYNLTSDLKITAGLRWTADKKRAPRIPSWLIVGDVGGVDDDGGSGSGYLVMEVVEQEWQEPTGRLAVDWKPDLAFTDDTLFYASYAHGYKAGGMNPPPAVLALYGDVPGLRESLIQPKTFDAEFIDAFEIGSKSSVFDGRLTFNANAFYYDYKGYQLSQIINRSAVTQNYDAKIWGLEIEADWRPLENFRLGFKGGYENTRVAGGESAIDLMDRIAGNPDWVVSRPFPTIPSNCIVPVWLVTFEGMINSGGRNGDLGWCAHAYIAHLDPVTRLPYVPNPPPVPGWPGYQGFDPASAPDNGEGFSKDLGGNELPNAPKFTTTITADYTIPLQQDWLLTLHADYYRQSKAWTRIFNFDPYDRLKPYENVNLAALLTNDEAGWTVMAYVKNVFDNDAITGAFLNSDDTGLTTNVFLLEPRLYGVRLTKQWTGAPLWRGEAAAVTPHKPGEPYLFTLELGGAVQRHAAPNEVLAPAFVDTFSSALDPSGPQKEDLDWGDGRSIKLAYQPDAGAWKFTAEGRFGRTNNTSKMFAEELAAEGHLKYEGHPNDELIQKYNYVTSASQEHEEHTLMDFMVGRDVGLGLLGEGSASTISVGVRHAKFKSQTHAEISGIPDYYVAPENILKYPRYHTQYVSESDAERNFKGTGPILSWEAAKRLMGSESNHLDLDWATTGGVLFGTQKASIDQEGRMVTSYQSLTAGALPPTAAPLPTVNLHRKKTVTTPTFTAGLGLSYTLERVKLSAGYRWERYFDVIDGGVEAHKSFDRTIDGPYFKVAIGFGG